MKKKLLTIAVTAAMVFSLVACGSNGGSNETKAVETSQQLRVLFLMVMVRKH